MLAYYFATLLPCYVNLFWVVTLLMRFRHNLHAQKIWIGLAAVSTVMSFVWAAAIGGGMSPAAYYIMEIAEGFALLLYFPLIYLYFRSLTDEREFSWREYLWFVPAVVVGGLNAAMLLSADGVDAPAMLAAMSQGGAEARAAAPAGDRAMYLVGVTLINVVVWIQMVWVMIYAVWRYVRYSRRLDDFFSNLEDKSVENNRVMIIGMFVMLFFSLLMSAGRYYYAEHKDMGLAIMVVIGVVCYVLNYSASQVQYTARDLARDQMRGDAEAGSDEYDPASVTEPDLRNLKMHALADDFERLLVDEHIFLQCDLRLDDVARMMRTNRAYISRMINDHFGYSFSHLINSRRVEWAQQMMRTRPELKIEQLAEMSGFANATYFSSMFRRLTGVTCREWRQRNGLV